MKAHLIGSSLRTTLAAAGLLLLSQSNNFSQINVGGSNGFGAPMASVAAGDFSTNNGTYSTIGGGNFGSDRALLGNG